MEFFTLSLHIHERRGVFLPALNNAVSAAQDHYHSLGFAKLSGPGAGVESGSVMEKLRAGNKKQKVDVTSVVVSASFYIGRISLQVAPFELCSFADPFSNLGRLMVFMLQTLTRGLAVRSGRECRKEKHRAAPATRKTYAIAKIS
jgi:hypothetical protein